jgi:hypothetical protein
MDKKKSIAALFGAGAGFAAGRAIDLALIGGSVATATGAVAFAGYMTLSGDHDPFVNGMQYLAIFSQPSHPHRGDADQATPFDMNPTGAIPPDAKVVASGYQLVGAQERFAWLREGNRIFPVRPGEEVPRLGHIAKIEKREGHWTLVDDKGKPLLVSAVADLMPSAGGKFDKQMIFGGEE